MKTYSILTLNLSDNDEDCSCSSCECSSNKSSEDIYQSYTDSIKRIKLDKDFILSVNNYLDRLKSNIYKDLIRHETLLRNGKNHARSLISLIRCIFKISYEQAHENFNASTIYTMTAIDYILQNHFPQKKPLLNYVLNEYISMWLHENLRIIQEDLSVIVENGTEKNFLSLTTCLLNKLESICAINWERLQMIQNYRLTHFDQLIKPMDNDLILLFGKSLSLTMKKSAIPITLLYSNRTDNELININEIDRIFRKSIAKILHSNLNEQDQISMKIKLKQNASNFIHTHQSSHSTVSDRSRTTDPNALIHFLTELTKSSMNQSFQLESHSQASINVKDPLFLAEFTRVLRKKLEDAQILREIDRGELNVDSQNIGYLSFETSNILKLPRMNRSLEKDRIDQNRVFIEVTHDPSKCSLDSSKSINSKSENLQQWYWRRSNENCRSKDYSITSNSLSCNTGKSSDSITIEHNEEFCFRYN